MFRFPGYSVRRTGVLFSRLCRKGNRLVVLLIALALLKGVVYAALVPPWQAPDEPKYLEYVWLLHDNGRLISSADASSLMQGEIIRSMAQSDFWTFMRLPQPQPLPETFREVWNSSSALGSPPLHFLFGLPAFTLVSGSDILTQLYVMRLSNVLLTTLLVVIAFLVARTLFPEDSVMMVGVPALLLFMPMYSFIGSSYTNQVMADVTAALWVYLMVVALKSGFSLSRLLALVGVVVLGYLSKRASLFVIPVSMAAVPLLVARRRGPALALRISILGGLAIAILVFFITSLPQGYGGLRWALLDRYFWGGTAEGFLQTLTAHDYWSHTYLGLLSSYFVVMFKSFWGVFGWMNVWLDEIWYWVLLALTLTAVSGLILGLASRAKGIGSLARWQRDVLLFFSMSIAFALVPIIAQYSAEFIPTAVPQGRYIFPLIIPISIFMVLGLRRLVPPRLVRVFPFALLALMFLFDTLSLALYIVPFYYG